MKTDAATLHLQNAFAAGRLASAYILIGNPREAGRVVAESVLQLLFCERGDAPCGACRACRQVSSRTHADVLWVEPQKKSRIISVDQIREVRQRIGRTAFAGPWKACVLVGCDRLGPEAGNALLKTLEEPAGDALFLLLTDSPQSLLPTIVSRCQIMRLQGDAYVFDEWDAGLIEILRSDPGSRQSVGRATAAFARADRLTALLKEMKDRAQEEINRTASDEDLEEEKDTLNARGSSRYREMRARLMRTMLLWYRDLLLVTCRGDATHTHFKNHGDVIRKRAEALTYRQAMRMVNIVEGMHRQMERNLPESTVLGYGFGNLER